MSPWRLLCRPTWVRLSVRLVHRTYTAEDPRPANLYTPYRACKLMSSDRTSNSLIELPFGPTILMILGALNFVGILRLYAQSDKTRRLRFALRAGILSTSIAITAAAHYFSGRVDHTAADARADFCQRLHWSICAASASLASPLLLHSHL